MGLLERISASREPRRSIVTVEDYVDALNSFTFQGNTYGYPNVHQTMGADPTERIGNDLVGYATGAFMSNGPVFACMLVRQLVFSAARFRWQRLVDGAPSRMFGSPELGLLEEPWTGGTTQDLLSRVLQYADLAGNSYSVRDTPFSRMDGDGQPEIMTLRPDWVEIALVPRMRRQFDGAAQVGWKRIGYVYHEGGKGNTDRPAVLLPEEVAHFAPIPDPLATYRGMSWLTPVIREIRNDRTTTRFREKFFENAAPQPLSARVLTPEGWSSMGAMRVGSLVIGRDGRGHRVTGVFPQGTKPIYRVRFGDGTSAECTLDHVWSVSNHYDRQRGVLRRKTLAELIDDGFHYPSGPAKWAVPMVDPVEFEPQDCPLPVDPYLMGLLLGDGSFRSNGHGSGGVTLACAASDVDETVETVTPVLPSGVSITRRDQGGWSELYFRGPGSPRKNPLTTKIRDLGLFDVLGRDKFIPAGYLTASIKERVALLQGLIDSDGHVAATAVRFTTVSRRLAADIADLVGSLGGTATVRPNKNRSTLTVTVRQLPDWVVPARLLRKATAYSPTSALRVRTMVGAEWVRDEQAQCIRVDSGDHLYVTDNYIVTHNTPNMVVKVPTMDVEKFAKFKAVMDAEHGGWQNAFKRMYLGGGADVSVVGLDFEKMQFDILEAAGEVRIASAAGVPPIIAGMSKGLDSATYSNYGQARRRFADGTIHPLWQNVAGSFAPLLQRPPGPGVRLWYDASDVPFLREDEKDAAEIQNKKAATINQLVTAGYVPETVVTAVEANDFRLLEHSGLYSVQLHPAGAQLALPAGGNDT